MNRYPTPQTPQANWDNLQVNPNFSEEDSNSQAVFLDQDTPDHQAERLRQNIEKDLVAALIYGTGLENQHNNTTSNDYYTIYNAINRGHLNRSSASRLIQTIPAPSEQENSSPQQVFNSFANNRQARGIIAMANNRGFNNRDQVTSEDVTIMLNRFPTPLDFIPTENKILEAVRTQNPPEKFAQYQTTMANFKQNIYGDRLLYSEAYLSLERQAARQANLNNTRSAVVNTYHDQMPVEQSTSNIIDNTAPYMAPEMQARFGDIQSHVQANSNQSQTNKKKPGLFGKLFGRKS